MLVARTVSSAAAAVETEFMASSTAGLVALLESEPVAKAG